MGILQNILKTINSAIDNIDFSPYQLISGKNTTNGYQGLNDIARQDSIFTKIPKTKYGWFFNYLLAGMNASNILIGGNGTGGGAFSTGGTSVTPKLKGGTIDYWFLPCIYLGASATGYANMFSGQTSIKIVTGCTIENEWAVAYKINSVKDFNIIISLGSVSVNNSGVSSGNGLIFIYNPTVNSGNFRLAKNVNGVLSSVVNTTVAPISETVTKFRIKYSRVTEIAEFYINHVLVGSISSVSLANTVVYQNNLAMSTNDATETNVRSMCALYSALEVDIGE